MSKLIRIYYLIKSKCNFYFRIHYRKNLKLKLFNRSALSENSNVIYILEKNDVYIVYIFIVLVSKFINKDIKYFASCFRDSNYIFISISPNNYFFNLKCIKYFASYFRNSKSCYY